MRSVTDKVTVYQVYEQCTEHVWSRCVVPSPRGADTNHSHIICEHPCTIGWCFLNWKSKSQSLRKLLLNNSSESFIYVFLKTTWNFSEAWPSIKRGSSFHPIGSGRRGQWTSPPSPIVWQYRRPLLSIKPSSQFSIYSFKEIIEKWKVFPSLHFLLVWMPVIPTGQEEA